MKQHLKQCFKCRKTKPITEFYRHPKMADGHLGKCKNCTRSDVNKNRYGKLERYRAYDRYRYETQPKRKALLAKRYGTEAQKESQMKSNLQYKKDRVKFSAHYLLSNAVRDKRIIKGSCEMCGSTENINGHHDDYYYPLTVRWLCRKCHYAYHKELRNKQRRS